MLSSVDVAVEPRAALCLRSGILALRQIADFYDIPHDADPAPDDPISITRAEFDAALDELEEVGVPIKRDRDQAWRDFNGWRVNYDTVLLALCALVWAPQRTLEQRPGHGTTTTTHYAPGRPGQRHEPGLRADENELALPGRRRGGAGL